MLEYCDNTREFLENEGKRSLCTVCHSLMHCKYNMISSEGHMICVNMRINTSLLYL